MRFIVFLLPTILMIVSGASTTKAQDPAVMGLSELQARADRNLQASNYVAARPFLEELVKRFEQEDEQIRANLAPIYYYIGLSYLQVYSDEPKPEHLVAAVAWLDRHEQEFPTGKFAVPSIFARADCYRALDELEKAADDYIQLLSPPLAARLNFKERNEAFKKLVESFYLRKDWDNGQPWFARFYQEALDPEDRAMAATALIEGYLAKEEFERVASLFSEVVGGSEARYKLQFNVALMQAGNKLSLLRRYSEATFMYRMVLSLEEIIEFYEEKLESFKSQLNLLNLVSAERSERRTELEIEVLNLEAQLEALRGVDSYTVSLKTLLARNYLLTNRDWEGFWAFERLIEEYPNSESIEDYFFSAFNAATKINFADRVISMGEAYIANQEWLKYKDEVIIKLCRFYIKEEAYDAFFQLAQKYIEEKSGEDETSQVVYLLGTIYMKLEQFDEMVDLFGGYTQKYKNVPIEDGCHYFLGMALLFLKNYNEAEKPFEMLLKKYPESPYREDAQYRLGICSFGVGNFEKARERFLQFVQEYPETKLRGEAEFFLGDIYAGLSEVDQALDHYSKVEKYTDNIIYIQSAYYQQGELLMAAEQYRKAMRLYSKFVATYSKQGEFTRAIYYIGVAHERLGAPEKMLEEYLDAIVQYGDDPIAYGLDKIIQSYSHNYYLHKNEIRENLEFLKKVSDEPAFRQLLADERRELFNYLNDHPGIYEEVKRPFYSAKFRARLLTDLSPVNAMIEQYEELWDRFPKTLPEDELTQILNDARSEGRRTLEIRAQMALDQLGVELIPEPIFSVDDFNYGSPASLIWMGTRISDLDIDAARQAFRRVVDQHPESDEVFTALLKLGEIEEDFQDFRAALYYYRRAEELFPSRGDVWEAIIKQGDVLTQSGDFLEARDVYQTVVKNREWRGEAHAEALYKIAECYQSEGRSADALGYFERIYIGYIAYYDWSSKAYLQAGRLYESLGNPEKAKEIYTEFVERGVFVENDPTALLIQKSLNALR